MLTREDCIALDAQDEMAHVREAFQLPEDIIYLDGNSLGALPKRSVAALSATVEQEWGEGLIRSWGTADWFSLPERLGDKLGTLMGAAPGQTVVSDSTSINIYKALRSAMALRPDRKVIVSELGSFPTDLYVLEGAMSVDESYSARLWGRDGDQLEDLINEDVAVVLLSHVDYRSGKLLDMEAITKLAHDAGALIIWDLCHTAGVVPMELDANNVDFAVGCTYKYLNGGPGSQAYIYVAQRHHAEARQPLSGWWSHAAPFAFESTFRPTEGARRFLVGTQSVLGLKGIEASLSLFEEMDIHAIRRKSQKLCDLFIELVEQHSDCQTLRLESPRDADQRGSHVSFLFDNGFPVVRAMIEQGVIGDFREPGIMRFGFAPYYLRFVDVYDAVEILADCMRRKVWENEAYNVRGAVT